MRFILMTLFVLFLTPLKAAEFQIKSQIDAVTVFPRGAEIKRTTRVEVPKGEHVIILSDLPAEADMNSIRVEGKATGTLEVGVVDARRIQVLRQDSEAQQSKRRQLETELERQGDDLKALQASIEVKEIQKRYIENLAALPAANQTPPSGVQGRAQEDWAQLLVLIGTSLTNIQKTLLEYRVQGREVSRRIEDLKKQLAELAPEQVQRTEARASLIAEADLTAELVIRYQVRNARWQPLYEARLETGSRNVPAKLALTRRASIAQNTGETWENAALALSTARPSGRSSAPELYPVTVDFYAPVQPAPAPMTQMDNVQKKMSDLRAGNMMQSRPKSVRRALPLVKERRAELDIGSYQAVFKVPGRLTVRNTGDAKSVKIETISLEPSLLVRSVPKFDARAYLYAKIKLPNGVAPILPGQAMLFRDQTFVGKGRMPQLAGGEPYELGFGADDAVRVKYNKVAESRGETGIISSSRTDQRKFKISIKNLHERPIAYSILDQRPESLNEDIKVRLEGQTKPTRQNVKDRRGVVAWEGTLAPDQEYIIDFGYVVSWPSDKRIRYKR